MIYEIDIQFPYSEELQRQWNENEGELLGGLKNTIISKLNYFEFDTITVQWLSLENGIVNLNICEYVPGPYIDNFGTEIGGQWVPKTGVRVVLNG